MQIMHSAHTVSKTAFSLLHMESKAIFSNKLSLREVVSYDIRLADIALCHQSRKSLDAVVSTSLI